MSLRMVVSREMGFDPGVFGLFDLAALVQPNLMFLFVCLFSIPPRSVSECVLVFPIALIMHCSSTYM